MVRTRGSLLLAGLVAAALAVSGCTQAPAPVTPTTPASSPAPGGAASVRTVDGVQEVAIEAGDFKFTPAELTLKAGKTKFVVPNKGAVLHEFLIYPQAQAKEIVEAHKTTMAGGHGHEHEHGGAEAAILVQVADILGGKSKESAVVDLKPGTYEIACLLPGHYEAGMKGRIVVG